MKERILAVAASVAIALSIIMIPGIGNLKTAAASAIVYKQNFDEISDFSALNWKKSSFANEFATWNIAEDGGNKQLVVDNLTEKAKGATAYELVSEETMNNVVGDSYEVSFNLTLLDADKDSRWCAVQLNGKDTNTSGELNYTRIAFRGAGYGAFETAVASKTTKHGSGVFEDKTYSAFDDKSITRWNMNEKFNVRIVVDYTTSTVRIYINNELNAVSTADSWTAYNIAAGNASAIQFYVSDNIKVALDDLVITDTTVKETKVKKQTVYDSSVIYGEDFEGLENISGLNWQRAPFSNETAECSLEEVDGNNRLVIDNFNVKSPGAAAFYVVPEEKMKNYSNKSYEVSFDLTILDADKDTRWCAIELNRNDKDTKFKKNYTRIAFRINGSGAFETFMAGKISGTTHKSGIFDGKEYPDLSEETDPPRWTFDEKFNARVVVDYKTKTVRLYINGNLTAVSAEDTWESFLTAAGKGSAVMLYVSDNIKIAVDNVVVRTLSRSPSTGDTSNTVIPACVLGSMICLLAVTLIIGKKRNNI